MDSRLRNTLNRILALPEFKVEMGVYCVVENSDIDVLVDDQSEALQTPNECGTAFCIVGRLAHEDGYPPQYVGSLTVGLLESEGINTLDMLDETRKMAGKEVSEDLHGLVEDFFDEFHYDRYSADSLGVLFSDALIWVWLFHSNWDDNLESAKARAWYVLEHDRLPVSFLEMFFDKDDAQSISLEDCAESGDMGSLCTSKNVQDYVRSYIHRPEEFSEYYAEVIAPYRMYVASKVK